MSDNTNKEVLRVMLSTLRRAMVAACACAALIAAVGAPAASATSPEYYHGNTPATIAPGYPWVVGNPHALTENAASPYQTACVGAIDYYGGTLASASYCGTFSLGAVARQSYCGCVTRDGAVYPYGSYSGFVFSAWESF